MGYGSYQVPDFVGNVRVDQTWGSAQVMAAVHEVNPTYYDTDANSDTTLGHPSDTWGFVVGAGLRLNFPSIAQGDYFQGEVNYTQGAMRYLNQPTQGNFGNQQSNTGSYGILSDCVYAMGVEASPPAGQTLCNLTTAWSVNAAFEHYWTPSVHESFVGAYEAVSYNNQANAILCFEEGGGNGALSAGGVYSATPGCNNNWSVWGASSRLQWDITKSFYMGVEVMYNHLDSAKSFNGVIPVGVSGLGGAPGPASGFVKIGGASENAWNMTVRMHKDFLP